MTAPSSSAWHRRRHVLSNGNTTMNGDGGMDKENSARSFSSSSRFAKPFTNLPQSSYETPAYTTRAFGSYAPTYGVAPTPVISAAPTPASSILRSHNPAASTTTARATTARRRVSVMNPPRTTSALLTNGVESYPRRTRTSMMAATIVAAVLMSAIALFARVWIAPMMRWICGMPTSTLGWWTFLARVLGIAIVAVSTHLVLRATETIMEFVPHSEPFLFPRIMKLQRIVSAQRGAFFHAVLCVPTCVIQTVVTSAIFGAVIKLNFWNGLSNNNIAALCLHTWLGACAGFSFSVLTQMTGENVWKFSSTKAAFLTRARRILPWTVFLTFVQCAYAVLGSFMFISALRYVIATLDGGRAQPAFTFAARLASLLSVVVTLLIWNLSLLIYKVLMTSPINVRKMDSDRSLEPTAIKENAEQQAAVFERLLSGLSQQPRADTGRLSYMLSLLYFRDVARTSRNARRIIFVDANGASWEPVYYACIEAIDSVTERISSSNMSRAREKSVLMPARKISLTRIVHRNVFMDYFLASPRDIMFGDGQCVIWACETISHLLVASREEDNYGLAQRTLVYVVMSLLKCKEQLDMYIRITYENNKGAQLKQSVRMTDEENEPGTQGIFERIGEQIPGNEYLFSDEVMATAVHDALTLALNRLIDAFRQHLQGYVIGSEPHWDRSLDRSLQAFLDMRHS